MNTTNEETKFYSWSCTTKQHQQRIDTVFVRNLLTSIFLISISWLEKGKPLKLCTQKYVAVLYKLSKSFFKRAFITKHLIRYL